MVLLFKIELTTSIYIFILKLFYRFDKRITAFAEDKFRRDGIDVKTGSMVVKVSDKEISTKEMKNGGEVSTIPYGMAVWSTGIGTRPFIKDFMSQIGQVCHGKVSILVVLINIPNHVSRLVLFIFHQIIFSFIYYLLEIGYSEQINRRAIATDEWLRVESTSDVYALGDCATINQRKVMVYYTI